MHGDDLPEIRDWRWSQDEPETIQRGSSEGAAGMPVCLNKGHGPATRTEAQT